MFNQYSLQFLLSKTSLNTRFWVDVQNNSLLKYITFKLKARDDLILSHILLEKKINITAPVQKSGK